ncbi:glycosyltransferase family 2 protein [Methylotetracoccus oryzae]|uniref:glycosyltransferase family 2 protein n=1 Tax=Methylotetracoccus oryzae TaxID=1919059 RepID=UPI0013A57A3B|nr:glycosyltransferase family A protein [Methylotetracoccus oryzae]
MNRPLISVIIPAYNAERTLADTLDSILAQTYGNIEVLVVDDGSTDATAAIVLDYAQRDVRVCLLQQPNGGVAAARNQGLAAARGDYVAPVDADDLWHPTKLEKQMAVMLAGGPELGLVYTLFRAIDEHGRIVWTPPGYACEGWVLARHTYVNFIGHASSLLLRKSVAVEAGGYEPGLRAAGAQGCEDYLLQLRIAGRYRFGCVRECLVGYRQRPDSMSSQAGKMLRSYRLALSLIEAERPGLPARLARWSIANYATVLAPTLARGGRVMQALGLFARAAIGDPVATVYRVLLSPYGYRLAAACLVSLMRRSRSQPITDGARQPFLTAATAVPSEKPALDLIAWRLRRLASVDSRLAPVRTVAATLSAIRHAPVTRTRESRFLPQA